MRIGNAAGWCDKYNKNIRYKGCGDGIKALHPSPWRCS